MSYDGEDVGYLTFEQFSRFRRAVHYSLKLVPWLRVAGYVKTGDPDEVFGGSVHPPLGVPPTWLAAEEISRLSQELNGWADLEDIAADDFGCSIAVQFTREVETAAAMWPFEDRPHRVQFVRCPSCGMVGLRYEPPTFEGDVIAVKCRECRHYVSEEEFVKLTSLIAAEFAKAKEGARERRLGDRGSGNGDDGKVEADDLQVDPVGEGRDVAAGAGLVA